MKGGAQFVFHRANKGNGRVQTFGTVEAVDVTADEAMGSEKGGWGAFEGNYEMMVYAAAE